MDYDDDDEEEEEEDDNAYIELFAQAVNTDVDVLVSKLIGARSAVAKASGQPSNATEWSSKFIAMMKEAQTCYVFNHLSHGESYVMPTQAFDQVMYVTCM
jgi:hypothetical protein